MPKTMLIAAMAFVVLAGAAFAQEPPDTGEIIFRVRPGTITLSPADSCIVEDQALAALVAAHGKLRWVREFRPGTGSTFVFVPAEPNDRSAIMASLSALPNVVHAEPNAILLSDAATSEPSDFYFQENYWPYPPFSESPTGLRFPAAGEIHWDSCSISGYHGTEVGTSEDLLHLADQWHLQMSQTNLAWLVEDGDPAVKVAIIDSGVDWRRKLPLIADTL